MEAMTRYTYATCYADKPSLNWRWSIPLIKKENYTDQCSNGMGHVFSQTYYFSNGARISFLPLVLVFILCILVVLFLVLIVDRLEIVMHQMWMDITIAGKEVIFTDCFACQTKPHLNSVCPDANVLENVSKPWAAA